VFTGCYVPDEIKAFMDKELLMYSRTSPCPFVTLARRALADYGIAYREILIDQDAQARQRVLDWTGFLAVPTLVAARPGEFLPYDEPAPLPAGASPRGINRGSMITEPNIDQLTGWLRQHAFLQPEDIPE
jgi:glutaredoxin